MATSGTYAFAPSLSDLIVNAFGRCQIRRPALTAEHLKDAATQANLLQVEWSLKGINLWTVELVSETLVEGTATYDVDPTTIAIMATYIETTANSTPTDRIIMSVSRDEYAAFPNKEQQSPPTCYWFDRLVSPTITLWPVPDDNGPYTLKYYRAVQIEDAAMAGGLEPQVPYRFLEAYAAGLAYKIAQLYAPTMMPVLKAEALEQWNNAAEQDVEDAPMYVSPMLGSYYR